jgi:alpha-tubulin suppressor-like RCC1 family protein
MRHTASAGLLASILLLLAGACSDNLPTVEGPAGSRQSAAVSVVSANPNVHLLPPLGMSAPANAPFDASLSPEVIVYGGTRTPCEVADVDGCSARLEHFTADGHGPDRVRLDAEGEFYHVNWKPQKARPASYRIAVRVGQQVIDNYDVTVTKPGTIPIRIRIEQGALALSFAEVGTAGATVSAAGGLATLEVPAGALTTTTAISVEAVKPGVADARVVGSVLELGPEGTTFETPVTVKLGFDEAALPAGVSPRLLRLHTFVGGVWQLVPESVVDVDAHTVSGQTSHFSSYAILPAAFTMVSSGEWHSCGLTSDGTAWCWGRNVEGQLGAPSAESCAGVSCAMAAVEVTGGLHFRSIEAGNGHTCAVTLGGEAFCWGLNSWGQLGDGTRTGTVAPVRAAPGLTFSSVSLDHLQTCGVTTSGDVYCWGANDNRQLGDDAATTCLIGTIQRSCSTTPVRVPIPEAAVVDVGLGHACALTTAKQMYCWGWNVFGQAGTGTRTNTAPPTLVSGGPYESISAGAVHNCMTRSGGIAVCFGTDYMPDGALGDGARATRLLPTTVAGGIAFAQVDASNGNYILTHTCGVSITGVAYCWGGNLDGQLGVETAPVFCDVTRLGPFDCALTPNPVSGNIAFSSITASAGFNCGYSVAGDVYCWGKNDYGQLGNGTVAPSRTPVKVLTAP